MNMRQMLILLIALCCAFPRVVHVQAQNTLEQRLDTLARKISDNLTENQKHTIAVVEFSDLKGSVTNFGRFLSEELITRLYQTKKFKVIERQQLNKIITEQKLSLTGVVDPASAQKLGRVLGVDSIVFGSISDLVRTLKINARLISAETGEVFAAAAIDIVKDDVVTSLMGDSISPNTSALPSATPSPSPRDQRNTAKSWRVDSNFFTFEIQKCRRSGDSVSCDFTVINNDHDREIGFYIQDGAGSGIKFFDNSNIAYNLYQIDLPTKLQMSKTFCCYTGYIFLVSGVQTKGRLLFNRVSQDATKIMLLTIHARVGEGNRTDFKVEFRNIPLEDN